MPAMSSRPYISPLSMGARSRPRVSQGAITKTSTGLSSVLPSRLNQIDNASSLYKRNVDSTQNYLGDHYTNTNQRRSSSFFPNKINPGLTLPKTPNESPCGRTESFDSVATSLVWNSHKPNYKGVVVTNNHKKPSQSDAYKTPHPVSPQSVTPSDRRSTPRQIRRNSSPNLYNSKLSTKSSLHDDTTTYGIESGNNALKMNRKVLQSNSHSTTQILGNVRKGSDTFQRSKSTPENSRQVISVLHQSNTEKNTETFLTSSTTTNKQSNTEIHPTYIYHPQRRYSSPELVSKSSHSVVTQESITVKDSRNQLSDSSKHYMTSPKTLPKFDSPSPPLVSSLHDKSSPPPYSSLPTVTSLQQNGMQSSFCNNSLSSSSSSSPVNSPRHKGSHHYPGNSVQTMLSTDSNMNKPKEPFSTWQNKPSVQQPLVKTQNSRNGVVGLRNLGNTCFMNSILQCLSSTFILTECLLSGDAQKTKKARNNGIVEAYTDLLRQMWSDNNSSGSVAPVQFKSRIQRIAPQFQGYDQHDSQEFLRFLLSGLHDELNAASPSKDKPMSPSLRNASENEQAQRSWRKTLAYDNSKISDIFMGQLKSTLRCIKCQHTSMTFDPFWDLSLPIPKSSLLWQSNSANRRRYTVDTKNITLDDCFKLFTAEERLDGDNKPICANCKSLQLCTKQLSIERYPEILVLHLKRFSGVRYRTKLNTNVDFTETMCLTGSETNDTINKVVQYDLYAVSNHIGSCYGGHYTAFCKHHIQGKWYQFNDTCVTPVSNSAIHTSQAYVLFYKKVITT